MPEITWYTGGRATLPRSLSGQTVGQSLFAVDKQREIAIVPEIGQHNNYTSRRPAGNDRVLVCGSQGKISMDLSPNTLGTWTYAHANGRADPNDF